MTQKTNGMQADNCKNIESKNGMSQVINILTGDRVKVKSQDTPADVIAISEDGQYYTVKFVQPVREFWTGDPMQTATYGRYGITRNYDRMTGEERVGNATYYAEQLKFGPGSIIEYELNGVELRTESTREDVEPDSREGWGNEFRVTIRHKSGDTCDTMTLGEVAELLARLYQEAGGNMSQEFIESDEEPSLEPASEIRAYNVGDRVQRIGTGATGIVDSLGRHEGRWTYNVRYDQTQRRPSDGFEYLTEEVFAEEIEKAKKESFGKMFIYRLYIKWKWMQQRFERIGDMERAADCFYHRLRLTKLYIYQPGWRIMDYGDMKPIFFPRQRIK